MSKEVNGNTLGRGRDWQEAALLSHLLHNRRMRYMGKDSSLKSFFLGISAVNQIPTCSPIVGPEARRSKATAIKRMEKAVDDTALSVRKSLAKKAPAKKKHIPAPHSISEIQASSKPTSICPQQTQHVSVLGLIQVAC